MDYLNDCNSYINGKRTFLNELEKHLPETYYRFIAPLKIVNYVNVLNKNNKHIDEDLQNILENSFTYIYESTELLNLYYNNYFQKNFSLMKKYDQLINYILYLEDISYIINNKLISDEIDLLIKKYESIIITKNNFNEFTFHEAETILLKTSSRKQSYSQQEIFEMIVEELNI